MNIQALFRRWNISGIVGWKLSGWPSKSIQQENWQQTGGTHIRPSLTTFVSFQQFLAWEAWPKWVASVYIWISPHAFAWLHFPVLCKGKGKDCHTGYDICKNSQPVAGVASVIWSFISRLGSAWALQPIRCFFFIITSCYKPQLDDKRACYLYSNSNVFSARRSRLHRDMGTISCLYYDHLLCHM